MDRKPVILIVGSHASLGGVRLFTEKLHGQLRQRDLEVRLLYLHRGTATAEDDAEVLVPEASTSVVVYCRAFFRLLRLMRKIRPVAVLATLPGANITANIAALLCGVSKRIASHHTQSWAQNGLLRILDRMLGSTAVFTDIVCISGSVVGSFSRYPASYRRKIRLILSGAEVHDASQSRAKFRRTNNIPGDAFLLVVVGRLAKEKNVSGALAAVAQVPAAHLLVVGDGPLHGSLRISIEEQELADRVILAGMQDQQYVTDALAAADVFLQPSFDEGRSLALMEAINSATCIIASNISSQREVLTLRDGSAAGLFCDPHDIDDMTLQINSLKESDALRNELKSKTAQLRRELPSIDEMIDAYVAVVQGSSPKLSPCCLQRHHRADR